MSFSLISSEFYVYFFWCTQQSRVIIWLFYFHNSFFLIFLSFISTMRTTGHIPCWQYGCLSFGMQTFSWKNILRGIDHKVMNYEWMLQNIPKTEDTNPIHTNMSFKSHHHKLQVKKSILPTPQELTTWHVIPHMSAKGKNNGNLTNDISKKAQITDYVELNPIDLVVKCKTWYTFITT